MISLFSPIVTRFGRFTQSLLHATKEGKLIEQINAVFLKQTVLLLYYHLLV
jgi:hypothetical protein